MENNKIFSSNYEEKLYTATGGISAADRDDELYVRNIVGKLGKSRILCDGSSTVLADGFKKKLDPDNYLRVAKLERDSMGDYFSVPRKNDTDLCLHDGEKYLTYTARIYETDGKKLCVLSDNGQEYAGFDDKAEFERALHRFSRFFDADPLIPEPITNAEQSRSVVCEVPYTNTETDWKTTEYTTCYSPSITIRHVNGVKTIVASHELSRVLNWKELDTVTVIKTSVDDGKSWNEVARIPHIRWGGLFEVGGTLYLSGTNGERKTVSLYRFKDDMSYDEAHFDFDAGWTSPNTVLIHGGRVYQALGHKVISADVGSDLLCRKSWTVSDSLWQYLSREWFLENSGEPQANRFTVMEGNMLAAPDGNIYNIMRIESQPAAGYAAILGLSPDGKKYLPVDSCKNLLRFPTSVSKFVIRKDEASGLYLSLTSVKTIENFGDQRNILALVWSKDLFDWKSAGVVLSDRAIMNPICSAYAHSFQYVDFAIDGDDIILLAREAAGRTNIWHDGNFITLYRIKDFGKLIADN